MQKSDDDIKLFSIDASLKTNVSLNEIKTTNVNILLNRVRIEKKMILKKNTFFIFNSCNNFCYFYCNNIKLNI